ncbi:TPA: hypothetical protein ACX9W5_004546 [Enterobacter asburiae]|nr:hypothetical protein [Enterobacter asburiae]
MSEVTDLVVIEKQNAMAVFTTKEQLDPITGLASAIVTMPFSYSTTI